MTVFANHFLQATLIPKAMVGLSRISQVADIEHYYLTKSMIVMSTSDA